MSQSNRATTKNRRGTAEPILNDEQSSTAKFLVPQYKPAGKLLGKRALITGGDSGIGRAVAILYAREGADVAITYLPPERKNAAITRDAVLDEGRKCVLIEGDLSDSHFCTQVIQRTLAEFGGIDILVSNSAHQMRKTDITEITKYEWEFTFKSNIEAYFLLAKCAIPHMPPGSAIIATASETETLGSKNLLDYSATKGAISSFTRSLAQNLVEKGIRVNAIAPGPVRSPAHGERIDDKVAGRPARPEEIAPAYVFLASFADSSYITGVVLPELGGVILH